MADFTQAPSPSIDIQERTAAWNKDLLETLAGQIENPEVIDGTEKLMEILAILNESGIMDILVTLMQFAGMAPDAQDPSEIVDKVWAYYQSHAELVHDLQEIQANNLVKLTKMLSDSAIATPAASLLQTFSQIKGSALQSAANMMAQPDVLAALPKMLELLAKIEDQGLLDSVLLAVDYLGELPDAINSAGAVDKFTQWLQDSRIVETAPTLNVSNLMAITQMASGKSVRNLMALTTGLLDNIAPDVLAEAVSLLSDLVQTLTDIGGWDMMRDGLKAVVHIKNAVDWGKLFPGVTDESGHLNWTGIVSVVQNVAADNQRKTSAFGGMKGMMALMRDPDVQKGMHFLTSLAGQLSHFAMSPSKTGIDGPS
jgi:uncharacterized protein YjgD (DUF1641 family)